MISILDLLSEEKDNFIEKVSNSVWSLAKYNNGYWKSDKQRDLITSTLKQLSRTLPGGDIYGNSYNYSVDWDDRGIINIVQNNSKMGKETVKFKRTDDKTFNANKEGLDNAKASLNKIKDQIASVNGELEEYKQLYRKMEKEFLDAIRNKASQEEKDKIANSFAAIFQNLQEKEKEVEEKLEPLYRTMEILMGNVRKASKRSL